MTDKGPVDGSLWIFKADQGKKPNKKVKKPSKDCNRENEKECAKQENEEEKIDESNSSEGILWQEDYHDSMNGDSYEQYFANSLCTNVPLGSLIVIDNAPYHSRNDETYPVSKWKKQQYIDWLKSKEGYCCSEKNFTSRTLDYVQTGKRSLPGQNCREYCKKCRT